MKKKYNLLLSSSLILLLMAFLINPVASFFHDIKSIDNTISTGSVDVVIENLKTENMFSTDLELNSLVEFSFTVKNKGKSDVNYNLSIGINYSLDLSEAGKFLVFPGEVDSDLIYDDIIKEEYKLALINNKVTDLNIIDDNYYGILENVANDNLQSLNERNYKYKLYYLEESSIKENADLYNNINLDLTVLVDADVIEAKTNWLSKIKDKLNFLSITNILYPVLEEVKRPKTFYISKANEIVLKDYVNAFDSKDDKINEKIKITSIPEFDSKKAGKYKIIYNVTNQYGRKAKPLEIEIVIWDFVKIESGNYHTLALTSHGKVFSWGFNFYGQIGDGTTDFQTIPKEVKGLENIVDIAASTGSSYALDANGQLYSWGRNDYGKLGDGTNEARTRPIKVIQPEEVKFVKISARFNNAGAIDENGNVYTWGYAGYGALGNGSTVENRIPTKIALENIEFLEMGYYNGAAIDKNGVVYTWGDNYHGQLGTGKNMVIGVNAIDIVSFFTDNNIKIKDISVGYYHMIATSTEGKVYTWGYGALGRLGNGSLLDKNTPQEINIEGEVKQVIAAYFHSAVLTTSGKVYFFGQNDYGKFGNGNALYSSIPVLLNVNYSIKYISLAYDSSFVLTDESQVYGMGYGGTGVLGTGNSNNSNIPVVWAFAPDDPY